MQQRVRFEWTDALAAFASWYVDRMARRICQLYDTFRQVPEMTGFRGLVYCRHYVSLQIAKPLGRLTWLLSVCHKVIIEDVARLDTRRGTLYEAALHTYTTVGGQPLSAQLVTCQQLNTTAFPVISPWLSGLYSPRWKGTIVFIFYEYAFTKKWNK